MKKDEDKRLRVLVYLLVDLLSQFILCGVCLTHVHLLDGDVTSQDGQLHAQSKRLQSAHLFLNLL